MPWLSWDPLREPIFLWISVLRVASRPRVKLTGCKSALNPPVVYSTYRSMAVVPVLVLVTLIQELGSSKTIERIPTDERSIVNTYSIDIAAKRKVREKSRECHNHKPQPFPDTKRKRKPTTPNKHKSNKCTESTKISSLFPKWGKRNAKRTENTRTKRHKVRHKTNHLVE